MPDARVFWVLLTMVPGIGPVTCRRLAEHFGDARAAWLAPPRQLAEAGLERRPLQALVQLRERVRPEGVWQGIERLQLGVLTLDDPDYPRLLREIPDPPPVLYLRGTIKPEDEWAVAVVGTRRVTAYGRQATARLAGDLARAGVCIVSGLAKGVDTLAHRAALEAGGRTIAVLGNGLDQVYPPENAALAQEIAARGALVSEFPPGVPPDAQNFPRRNRVISGLARATLVVEASPISGALITAERALEQGRDVFAVPGSIFSPQSEGPNTLIRDGARPVLTANDLLEELHFGSIAEQKAMRETLPADETEAALLRLIGAEPVHLDELGRAAGLPIAAVSSALTMLELKGLVRQVGSLQYVRS